MTPAPHVITQQRLHLRLGPAADGPALHRRAEHTLLGPPLLAALHTALSQALASAGLAPEAWLTLDRLTLDLGALPADALETHLLERLPGLLRQVVAEAVGAAATLAPGPAAPAASAGATLASGPVAFGPAVAPAGAGVPASGGAAPAGWDQADAASLRLFTDWPATMGASTVPNPPAAPAVHQASAPVAAGAAWLFFLRHGALPAHWPPPASPAAWEAALLALLATPPPGLPAALGAALSIPAVRLRLLRQFSPALVAAVLVALVPGAAPHRTRLSRLLAGLRRQAVAAPAADLAPPTTAPATVGAGSDAVVAGEAVGLALLARVAGPAPVPPHWGTLLAAVPPSAVPAAQRVAHLGRLAVALAQGAVELPRWPSARDGAVAHPEKAAFDGAASGQGATGAGRATDAAGNNTLVSPPVATGKDVLASLPDAAGENTPVLPPNAAEYVTNAGVVLLHPFLPQCFAACGWLDADNQFASPDAQAQAVLLVHFLATGRGQAPEYELRLPRLLCGVPPTVASPRLVLGRAPRAEGRALLRAAVAHWAAVRNTTPTALRTAFLRREGKLEAALPDGPLLTVAQQAQDVLLSRLPYGWGVGLVQLPWLPRRLRVNWA